MKSQALLHSLAAWVRRNRVSTTIVLLMASGASFMYQEELRSPLPNELRREGANVTYVGELERVASGGNRQSFNIHINAGYGVGFPNEDKNELFKKYRPTVFVPFSSALALSEDDLAKIVPNNTYLLTLWRNEIIEVSGKGIPIIPIERFTAAVESSKQRWQVTAVVLLLASLAYFFSATILQRSESKSLTAQPSGGTPDA